MKQEWNRIVEVRGRSGQPAGLEYSYPCGHSAVVTLEEVKASLKDGGTYPDVKVCPTCPE